MEFSSLNLLYDVAWMSVLLLIAKVIRSKVHFVQKLYIPQHLLLDSWDFLRVNNFCTLYRLVQKYQAMREY